MYNEIGFNSLIENVDQVVIFGSEVPSVITEVYTYTRTYSKWFGYIYQPNSKDHFISPYEFKKGNNIIQCVKVDEIQSS